MGHPALGTPTPYSVSKLFVFMSLREGIRCKIVKIKKFPAESSRIRSYGTIQSLSAASARERSGGLEKTSEIDYATKKENYLQKIGQKMMAWGGSWFLPFPQRAREGWGTRVGKESRVRHPPRRGYAKIG